MYEVSWFECESEDVGRFSGRRRSHGSPLLRPSADDQRRRRRRRRRGRRRRSSKWKKMKKTIGKWLESIDPRLTRVGGEKTAAPGFERLTRVDLLRKNDKLPNFFGKNVKNGGRYLKEAFDEQVLTLISVNTK